MVRDLPRPFKVLGEKNQKKKFFFFEAKSNVQLKNENFKCFFFLCLLNGIFRNAEPIQTVKCKISSSFLFLFR